MNPGLVIIDTTFLRRLASPASAVRIRTALRSAELQIYPSITNALEALSIAQSEKRQKYLAAITACLDGRPLLPFPTEILRSSGLGLSSGAETVQLEPGNADLLVTEPTASEANHEHAKRTAKSIESIFNPIVADRQAFQKELKRSGKRHEWNTIPEFLQSEWASLDNLNHLANQLWEGVGLTGDAPALDLIWRCEPWRIAMEAIGATIFERAIRFQQKPKRPGVVDLLQLLYLSLDSRCRVFVTDDQGLHEVASALLVGRYANVRVMKSVEFLERAA